MPARSGASSGHRLGQLVGDWWEEFVVAEIIDRVAKSLNLYADHRFVNRSCRSGKKILWSDIEGNKVDYDFVLEIDGTDTKKGTPVAFIESFWRRGARHSKDKARDDTTKLLPMRDTYPTARFLAIAASGEFTSPASDFVRSRGVELFYIPKEHIISAFQKNGIQIDYPDTSTELEKAKVAERVEATYTPNIAKSVATTLSDIVGKATLESFFRKIVASLSAMPVEYAISSAIVSQPKIFDDAKLVTDFLRDFEFDFKDGKQTLRYDVTYSDGTKFESEYIPKEEIDIIHLQVQSFALHMSQFSNSPRP